MKPPGSAGLRTYRLPFDLDAGGRGRLAVRVTLKMEILDDDGGHDGRPAIGVRDLVAWLEGERAEPRFLQIEVIDRARRMAAAGRWEEFRAQLLNGGHAAR